MDWTKWLACGAVLALTPISAGAQERQRWDVAPFAGLFTGHTAVEPADGYQEDWFQSLQGGIVLGRYLSPHLKVEIEASASTGGTRYVSRSINLPGEPYPFWFSTEHVTTVQSVGGAMAWQFRDNEWVHPFVEAGISTDVNHHRLRSPDIYVPRQPPGSPGLIPPNASADTTSVDVRAVLGGGAKIYFRERGFVRTDARLNLVRDEQTLAFRIGVGIDF